MCIVHQAVHGVSCMCIRQYWFTGCQGVTCGGWLIVSISMSISLSRYEVRITECGVRTTGYLRLFRYGQVRSVSWCIYSC